MVYTYIHLHYFYMSLDISMMNCIYIQHIIYRIAKNFGSKKHWQIWQMKLHSPMFLNQSHAGLWPAHDWFLEIAFVCDVSVYKRKGNT